MKQDATKAWEERILAAPAAAVAIPHARFGRTVTREEKAEVLANLFCNSRFRAREGASSS